MVPVLDPAKAVKINCVVSNNASRIEFIPIASENRIEIRTRWSLKFDSVTRVANALKSPVIWFAITARLFGTEPNHFYQSSVFSQKIKAKQIPVQYIGCINIWIGRRGSIPRGLLRLKIYASHEFLEYWLLGYGPRQYNKFPIQRRNLAACREVIHCPLQKHIIYIHFKWGKICRQKCP